MHVTPTMGWFARSTWRTLKADWGKCAESTPVGQSHCPNGSILICLPVFVLVAIVVLTHRAKDVPLSPPPSGCAEGMNVACMVPTWTHAARRVRCRPWEARAVPLLSHGPPFRRHGGLGEVEPPPLVRPKET